METSEAALLGREWTALHRDCEASERSALWIKLAAVALTAVAVALNFDAVLAIVLVGVLWVQEAVVRTGQARLVDRLLRVEAVLRDVAAAPRAACQLYSDWLATRPGALGLLAEYLAAAVRPTVAFPYAVLVVLLWALAVIE
ncbi:hypothetical protein [Pseudorhodoferax sp. Leaf274]|uniref:hypothetical protein n=1 Tax=Pseudorhodoferax sp. Leaf274 TaxID=1736318 RepID=UPI00070248FC|nr:hypothetical protein [Pseudorhodoferax sp. Leaf274]KQP37917.1 hypothetical protein ASF44_11860 [Pseudorhodoferax sp. Leaf274]